MPLASPLFSVKKVCCLETEPSLELLQIPIEQVAPHPANPRRNLGNLSEMAASITVQGLLIPLVTIPAEHVVQLWPDHASALDGKSLVVLSGHRRLEAATRAADGDTSALISVAVRRDAICSDVLAQLAFMRTDNIARSPLTPMEEARSFQQAKEAGFSQRQIARETGCDQSHVCRRLALLKLPEALFPHIDSGKLPIHDGLRLAAMDGHETMLGVWRLLDDQGPDRWITTMNLAIEEHDRRTGFQRQREASVAQAAAEGIELVDGVAVFGRRLPAHRLTDPADIESARSEGVLVADIDNDGNLTYFTTAGPVSDRPKARGVREAPERPEQVAARFREQAALVLVARPPRLNEAAADIVAAWIDSASPETRRLARRWLEALRIDPSAADAASTWWQRMRHSGWSAKLHAAHALALARSEVSARVHKVWDADDITWLQRLVDEAGYIPTDWERERLRR